MHLVIDLSLKVSMLTAEALHIILHGHAFASSGIMSLISRRVYRSERSQARGIRVAAAGGGAPFAAALRVGAVEPAQTSIHVSRRRLGEAVLEQGA
jgi:hypothetical protein